jgi:hypothetical protein
MRDSDEISDSFRRLRRRQIARLDQTAHARPVGAPIAESGAAFEDAGRGLREKWCDREAKDSGNAQAKPCINKPWIDRAAHEVSREN